MPQPLRCTDCLSSQAAKHPACAQRHLLPCMPPVVAAGEVAYVRSLIAKHHEEASAKKLRIVPCCGFDSAPFDLGALLVRGRMHVCAGQVWEERRAAAFIASK